MTQQVLLPGDLIPTDAIPTSQKRRLNPSIKYSPQSNTYTSSIAGLLRTDFRRKSANIQTTHTRYIPQPGDDVIAQIRLSSQEVFHAYITPYGQQAILQHLSFEGATKKTRPMLKAGDLVYAKIISATKGMDIELSCVNPSTGKSDGFGPLTGGNVIDVSVGFADRLQRKEGVQVLMEELGLKLPGGLEIAVGKNGKVWINCPESGAAGCILVGRCLTMADDGCLKENEQRKIVRKIAGEMGLT